MIAGVAIGAIGGAIAGVLLAPKSGHETRADIAKHLHEMKDTIAKELHAAGKFSKEKYTGIVKKVVAGYEKAKKITAHEAKEIAEKLEKSYAEVEKAAKKS